MNDKWTWNFDVYDESDSPTKEGYYRIIDDEGNEMVDYFFGEPRMTPYGIGYWRNCKRPIIAWKIAEQTEPQTIDAVEVKHGRWIRVRDPSEILMNYYVCDKCGSMEAYESNYCPNCGAKMDGEREGE